MKRTTTDQSATGQAGTGGLLTRLGWFVGIWAASVAALSIVACILHKIILG
jgi:hypothetical protein